MALPLFSPVRIGDRHYLEGGPRPRRPPRRRRTEGRRPRDCGQSPRALLPPSPRGSSRRATASARACATKACSGPTTRPCESAPTPASTRTSPATLPLPAVCVSSVLEPRPTDALLFLHNPAANISARRAILEYAYRTTRERIEEVGHREPRDRLMPRMEGGAKVLLSRAGLRLRLPRGARSPRVQAPLRRRGSRLRRVGGQRLPRRHHHRPQPHQIQGPLRRLRRHSGPGRPPRPHQRPRRGHPVTPSPRPRSAQKPSRPPRATPTR